MNKDIKVIFNSLLEVYSISELADHLYIHKGTINRWRQTGKIPEYYKDNFLRILTTNSALNLRTSLIESVVINKGVID